jgi:hypothetical protein
MKGGREGNGRSDMIPWLKALMPGAGGLGEVCGHGAVAAQGLPGERPDTLIHLIR